MLVDTEKKISPTLYGKGNVGNVERGVSEVVGQSKVLTCKGSDLTVEALNIIKPAETMDSVVGMTDNEEASRNCDLLVGATAGEPVITRSMVQSVADDCLLLDGGKGCFTRDAIRYAEEEEMAIYRVDIRAGFEGEITRALEAELILSRTVGRREIEGVDVVSGGLMAREGEVVVDNFNTPTMIYGVADGAGDFFRVLSQQQEKVEWLRSHIVSS